MILQAAVYDFSLDFNPSFEIYVCRPHKTLKMVNELWVWIALYTSVRRGNISADSNLEYSAE